MNLNNNLFRLSFPAFTMKDGAKPLKSHFD